MDECLHHTEHSLLKRMFEDVGAQYPRNSLLGVMYAYDAPLRSWLSEHLYALQWTVAFHKQLISIKLFKSVQGRKRTGTVI